jgi:hypothetical protein
VNAFDNLTTDKGEPLFPSINNGFFEEGLSPVHKKWIANDVLFVHSYGELDKNTFNVNSKNYRSDEFTSTHSGLHILFAGCSHALGVGLADNERWSQILYDKINSESSCSGYFNIARSGSSIKGSIINIFKYFEEYEKPDLIFFGVPEINRSITFLTNSNAYLDVTYENNIKYLDNADLYFDSYHYYKMLELFCKGLGIKLISFDSDIQAPDEFGVKSNFTNFDTYHDLVRQDAVDYMYEYSEKNKGRFDMKARDTLHYGVAVNSFIAERLYKIYEAKI